MVSKLNPVRRIVTGHDADGKAIISSDGAPSVSRVFSEDGLAFHELWNTSQSPVPIDSGADPSEPGKIDLHPPKGGSRLRIVDFPPENPANLPTPAVAKGLFSEIGLHDTTSTHSVDRHHFMHRTESIDYGIVLSGGITLILDDEERDLTAGDIIVQRGTIHAWSNRTDEMCRIAFILLDGEYEPWLASQIRGR